MFNDGGKVPSRRLRSLKKGVHLEKNRNVTSVTQFTIFIRIIETDNLIQVSFTNIEPLSSIQWLFIFL